MSATRELALELPATAESARTARRAVDTLPLDEHSEASFNLRLLITELVSTILRPPADSAPPDTITLVVRLQSDRVRVEANGRGPGGTRAALATPLTETHGRGLLLIAALADDWGRGPDAPQIWFELRLPPNSDGRRDPR